MTNRTRMYIIIGSIIAIIAIIGIFMFLQHRDNTIYSCVFSWDESNKVVTVRNKSELLIYEFTRDARNYFINTAEMPDSPVIYFKTKLTNEDFKNIRKWARELANPNLKNKEQISTGWAGYDARVGNTRIFLDAAADIEPHKQIIETLRKYHR